MMYDIDAYHPEGISTETTGLEDSLINCSMPSYGARTPRSGLKLNLVLSRNMSIMVRAKL